MHSPLQRSNTFAGRIWSAEKRTPQSKQGRGYLRVRFEEAWRRYLDDEEQEHEPSKSAGRRTTDRGVAPLGNPA